MTIPFGYSRNVFNGTLPGGEIFGWSLWCSEAPSGQAATQAQANAVAAAFTSVSGDGTTMPPKQLINSAAAYTNVTTYSYELPGGKASAVAQASIAQAGVGTGAQLPNQCAVACTLHTGHAGRSNRGRVYLPLNSLTLGVGAQLSQTQAAQISLFLAKLITQINTAVNPGKVVVLSQKHGSSWPIIDVKVDTRVDIQRRRANRQAPAASGTSVVV